jgi:hypothetical protein
MAPYIPVYQQGIAEALKEVVNENRVWVWRAKTILEDNMPEDFYAFVSDGEVGTLAVALAIASDEEFIDGIIQLIKALAIRRGMCGV